MRSPSSTLVVDAAVLVAAARGRSSGALLQAARAARFVTTDRVVQEARRRIELGLNRPELVPIIDALVAEMTVVPLAALTPLIEPSETALKNAVASGNGSKRDAHVLALAWSVAADIWTTDRDFAGTGVASWSTRNLMRGMTALTFPL
ncbi:MAG TPA: PIN domain-containing protein [Methylocystis sp.]|nr:PIN domain-containing protein [Methylocystis sp.]